MKKATLGILIFFFCSLASADNAIYEFVVLETSMGDIKLRLFKRLAPRSVENFVALVKGTKSYRDIKTGRRVKNTPFYKDMIFHKVHPELGIQSGCPWGNGTGWPGYTIKGENNGIKFSFPFQVAMARIPGNENSVGSQFFINTKVLPYLDNKYTIIGNVVSGHDIVRRISNVPRDAMMRPLTPIKLVKAYVVEG